MADDWKSFEEILTVDQHLTVKGVPLAQKDLSDQPIKEIFFVAGFCRSFGFISVYGITQSLIDHIDSEMENAIRPEHAVLYVNGDRLLEKMRNRQAQKERVERERETGKLEAQWLNGYTVSSALQAIDPIHRLVKTRNSVYKIDKFTY